MKEDKSEQPKKSPSTLKVSNDVVVTENSDKNKEVEINMLVNSEELADDEDFNKTDNSLQIESAVGEEKSVVNNDEKLINSDEDEDAESDDENAKSINEKSTIDEEKENLEEDDKKEIPKKEEQEPEKIDEKEEEEEEALTEKIQDQSQEEDHNDDDDDDDFGDFSDASFDDFEAPTPITSPPTKSRSQPIIDPNTTPLNDYIKLSSSIYTDPKSLNLALDALLDNIYPQTKEKIATDKETLKDLSANDLLLERSGALWNELKSLPRLNPPDWKRSSIRRHFLISIGVPIDLDEILPNSTPVANVNTPNETSPVKSSFGGFNKVKIVFAREQRKDSNVIDIPEPKIAKEEVKLKDTETSDVNEAKKVEHAGDDEADIIEAKFEEENTESESTEEKEENDDDEEEEEEDDDDGDGEEKVNEESVEEDLQDTIINDSMVDVTTMEEKIEEGHEIIHETPILEEAAIIQPSDHLLIPTIDDFKLSKPQKEKLLEKTSSLVTSIEDTLQPKAYYENLLKSEKLEDLEKVSEILDDLQKEMVKTLSCWDDKLQSLINDKETFEAVVENMVGYTQKLRRQETFEENKKEMKKHLKRKTSTVKKKGYFWNN